MTPALENKFKGKLGISLENIPALKRVLRRLTW